MRRTSTLLAAVAVLVGLLAVPAIAERPTVAPHATCLGAIAPVDAGDQAGDWYYGEGDATWLTFPDGSFIRTCHGRLYQDSPVPDTAVIWEAPLVRSVVTPSGRFSMQMFFSP